MRQQQRQATSVSLAESLIMIIIIEEEAAAAATFGNAQLEVATAHQKRRSPFTPRRTLYNSYLVRIIRMSF